MRTPVASVAVLLGSSLGLACTSTSAAAARSDTSLATEVVRSLEPGFVASASVAGSAEAWTIAAFLDDATAAEPDSAAAADAMAALSSAYGGPGPGAGPPDRATNDEVRAWASSMAEAVRTHAVLITDDHRRATVTHAAVFWDSPLAQRLRIVRIPDALRTDDNREAILGRLGTCAVEVEEWVSAPESRALAFLTEHVRASMLVVGRDPATGETVEAWIGPEEVIAALRFEHPRTAGLAEFSAWFAGEGPAPLALTRLIPTLRSSLGPGDLLALIRSLR